MPKLKTRSSAKKRLYVKKSGKVLHGKAFSKHLFTFSKDSSQKRGNRGTSHLKLRDAKKVVREMFPYGSY